MVLMLWIFLQSLQVLKDSEALYINVIILLHVVPLRNMLVLVK